MTNNYVYSNITPEEYFKHYCDDENAIRFFESYTELNEENEKEIESQSKANEILSEQIYFAEELIKRLEKELDNSSSFKDFKKKFKLVLSESMFER